MDTLKAFLTKFGAQDAFVMTGTASTVSISKPICALVVALVISMVD